MAIRTEEEFIELVKKAEREAQAHPGLYKTKLGIFAVLGYTVLFGILFTLIALIGGSVAAAFYSSAFLLLLLKKKLIVFLAIAAWVMIKALWVKIEPPTGYTLERKDFPELFTEIDGLRKKLKAPPIHQVILTSELNAAIGQYPRLGILGWNKNVLVLGLQLLLTLSPDEMRSVLAHELGHLSGNHSRFSAWIYRVRLTWQRVMNAFQDSTSMGAKSMRKFFDWYAPKFAAYSFALARSNEYDADAIAAKLTSAETAARALLNVYVTAPYVDIHYWDWYFKKADAMLTPDHPPYEGLAHFLGQNPQTKEKLLESIKEELGVETSYYDTHPSLKDRIEALHCKPVIPMPPHINAASAWLGNNYDQVVGDFDNLWIDNNQQPWQNRYQYVTESTQKLHELESKDITSLNDEELWNRAYLTEEFKTSAEALPLFHDYQARQPDDADAAYMIGVLLYKQDDEACLSQLKSAAKQSNLTIRSCEIAYQFLKRHNRDDEAEHWYAMAEQQAAINREAEHERQEATIQDTYQHAQMDETQLENLKQQLITHPKVSKVWLAQKQVFHYPESPVYIIAIKPKGFNLSEEKLMKNLTQSIKFNGDLFIVVNIGNYKKLAKMVKKAGDRII